MGLGGGGGGLGMGGITQGYSSVLGTAAQITTFACMSLRAYIGRRPPSGLELRDYALAAAGLLNFRGALVSCFAALLFICVMFSFAWARFRVAELHSPRGTLSYSVWKLIYERIETSSTSDLLKFLAKNCGCIAPAVPKSHGVGYLSVRQAQTSQFNARTDFTAPVTVPMSLECQPELLSNQFSSLEDPAFRNTCHSAGDMSTFEFAQQAPSPACTLSDVAPVYVLPDVTSNDQTPIPTVSLSSIAACPDPAEPNAGVQTSEPGSDEDEPENASGDQESPLGI